MPTQGRGGSESTGQGTGRIVSMQEWCGDRTQLKGMCGAFAIAAERLSTQIATRVWPARDTTQWLRCSMS
jgi:hypothetical protein